VIFVAALFAILAAIAIPQATATVDRSRAWAATRYLWGQMALARAQAVKRSATVALRFEGQESRITFTAFADGNRNGVRTADIAANIDTRLDGPVNLSDMFPGVTIGVVPETGVIDPLQIGTSRILSFTSLGTATPGTVYIRGRDGSQFAVRVLGPTARTRVLRYVPATRNWVDSF
jgi:type II secretory pathway pseudopilin PulG